MPQEIARATSGAAVGKLAPSKPRISHGLQNAKPAVKALFGDTPVLSSADTSIDITSYSVLTGAAIERVGGSPDIGYMASSGADIEYKVNVATAGSYRITVGVAAIQPGSFSLQVNGSTQAQYAFSATNAWQTYTNTSQTVTLPAGATTIKISPTLRSQFNINAITLSPISTSGPVTNVGNSPSIPVTSYSAIFGSQLEYLNGNPDIGYVSPSGAYVEYTLNVPTAGNYTLSVGTAQPSSARFAVSVNGIQSATYSVGSTGSWTNFAPSAQSVYLPAGKVTLRLSSLGGTQYNIGAIDLSAAPSNPSSGRGVTTVGSSAVTVPVASYSKISNSQLEYQSGVPDIGYVSTSGALVEYTLNVQTAGNYQFDMNVATPGQANFDLYVNGTKETIFYSASTGGWNHFSTVTSRAYLPAGPVTIRFQSTNATQYNLGDFRISPATETTTAAAPAAPPANTNSTGSVVIFSQWMTSLNQLNIVGSTGNDSIFVAQSGNTINVTANGQTTSYEGQYGNIVIKSNGGNDSITVDPSVSVDTLVYGGTGQSTIKNGTRAMATVVTVGGSGNVVQGNGFNSSLWISPTDAVNATATERSAGEVHVVSTFAYGVSTALSGQNLPDPVGTGTTTRLSNSSLWGTGPTMTDINQGQVGDCYFLGVLQTAALSNPSGLQQLAVDLGDGTYAVQFKRGGTTTYVRVDGDLPTGGPYANGLEYAHPGPSGDQWALIMEKAYAEFRTGAWTYDSTGWGAFSQVAADFGIKYTSFWPQADSSLFAILQQGLAAGKGITVGTNPSIKAGAPLIESHQYTVTNAWKDASGNSYVTLRNPWGFDGAGQDSNPGDALVTMTIDQLGRNIEGGIVF